MSIGQRHSHTETRRSRLAPARLASVSVEWQKVQQLCTGEILPAEVPAAEVVTPQSDALQVLRLVAGRGVELRLGEARDVVSWKLPPSPPPRSGWHWSASSSCRDCAGEILPAEVPAGEVVAPQSDALQVLRLVTGGGASCAWVKPRDVVSPKLPPSPPPRSGWHWSASRNPDSRW